MVLKRLMVTALGALGLGALAAGPTSAQEIPAPDLFDGQVACSMNVPVPPMTLVGQDMDGDDIGITAKIESGMTIALTDGVPSGDDLGLADILYVIDPNLGNCGAGTYSADEATAFNTANSLQSGDAGFLEAGDAKPIEAGIAADVGAGYSDTLAKFMAAMMADEAVETAQKALDDLPDTATDAQRAPLQTALNNAITAQSNAHTALYATAEGPINMAGLAEWRAKGAVEMAVAGWNTAVTMADTARATVVASAYNDKYVQVESDQLLALVDGSGNVNLANVRQYANAAGDNTGVQDAMTGVITGDSAFDAAGNLILPMELWDHDDDAATDQVLRVAAVDSATYMTVDDRLTAVNDVVKALEKLQTDNQNALLQPAIDEAVRRAKVEQGHYQAQYNAMIADETDLRAANQMLPFIDSDNDGVRDDGEADNPDYVAVDNLKTRYDAYKAAETTRDNAGVTLESAVEAREIATAAVRTAFTNPQSFYQQLVDRKATLKGRADAEVTRLEGLTGDDAPTEAATMAAATAATNAQTALEAAQTAQASFQDLLADDSPVKDLVLETLKPDEGMGQGDDGQALVDAIVGVNDTATDALAKAEENTGRLDELFGSGEGDGMDGDGMDGDGMEGDDTGLTIDEIRNKVENNETAITEASNAIVALEADDNPDTPDVDETGPITANANNISDNSDAIAGLEDEVLGDGDADNSRIDQNAAAITEGDAATLEAAGTAATEGDAATLASAAEAADAGDAATLASAGEAADAGDAATLASAGEAADAGDAATLASAAEAAEAGDAATLAAAAEAAEAGDAATLASAGEAADAGDAATLASAAEAAEAGDAALGVRIDTEATTRETADTALGGRIDTEATTRETADTALGGRIDTEATTRETADTALGGRIDTEATTRETADTALGGRIDAEATAREMADTALGGRIDDECCWADYSTDPPRLLVRLSSW